MTALPRISIIIPAFNAAAYVSATVSSALAQAHEAFEVILVDDGSSDETTTLVAGIADPRLYIIEQPNAGAAAARNRGLSSARGRYILFLDADDLIPENHIAALEAAISGSQNHVAFGQWDRFYTDPAEARFPPRSNYRDADPADWLVEDWRPGNQMTQCGTFLIPRALLDRTGGWDERLSLIDDFEFFSRILCESAGLRFAAAARVFYRSGVSGTLSASRSADAVHSAWMSLCLGTAHLLKLENTPRTRRAAANILRSFDYEYFPAHSALRKDMRERAARLGGADIEPDGPPGFHLLRRAIGWQMARRAEHVMTAVRRKLDSALR